MRIDKSQMWFWSKEHQDNEKAAEEELSLGKGKKARSAKNLIYKLNR